MRTEQSKSQAKGFRFNLRLFSILFVLGIVGIGSAYILMPAAVAHRQAAGPRRSDSRAQDTLAFPVVREKKPAPAEANKVVDPLAPGPHAQDTFVLTSHRERKPVPVEDHKSVDFRLQDPRDQDTIVLSALREKNKAVVVVFIGVECPLINLFAPVLIELHKEYSSKGIAFVGINANSQDSLERVAMHARKYAFPFPIVKDVGNKVADHFGARRTPEAFIVDRSGAIRYQGRIDDQFGIGFARPGKPSRRDLAAALDEVLAGREVSVPRTEAPGCCIGRVAKPKADGRITYAKQVSRIIQKNCQECHRPGQIGAMSLLHFEDAVAWSETIREVVSEGRMPPWYADPRYGKFSNDRRLSPEEKETLLSWIDNHTPRGDDKDLPPPRRFPEGWQIGKPDLIVKLPKPYEVPAKSPPDGVPYQYITADPHIKEDCWVQRAEIRPGAPGVVHHSVVFVQEGKNFEPNAPGAVLCGFAPGEMPLDLPDGFAKKIRAGSKFVFQMHYTPNGTAQSDQSCVGLVFSKKPPLHRVLTIPIYDWDFQMRWDHIPAGNDNYKMESKHVFGRDAHLLAFMPHMHLRGKDFLYEANYPNGKREILLSVPHYDFSWQGIYRLAEPLPMPKGTKLHCISHFDNSAKNPNNPDPKKDVYWGWQTWEEMMTGWIDYFHDDEKP